MDPVTLAAIASLTGTLTGQGGGGGTPTPPWPAKGNEARRFLGLSGEDWQTVGATLGVLNNLLGGGAREMQAPGVSVNPVPALQLMGLDTSPGRVNVATNFGIGLPYASTSGIRGV